MARQEITIGLVGLGLIGGSAALKLKEHDFAGKILLARYGVISRGRKVYNAVKYNMSGMDTNFIIIESIDGTTRLKYD